MSVDLGEKQTAIPHFERVFLGERAYQQMKFIDLKQISCK